MLIAVATLLFSATASAYDFEVDGFYYNIISLSDLTVEVTAGDNKYSGELIIPSTVNYKSKTLTVTSIRDDAFWYCSGLTSVTIPNSVTSIGTDAFSYCSGLTSITIPNSVTSIGYRAFYDCSGLTSIVIPNSVTSIEMYAFYGCSGLTSVTIGNSVTSIGSSAFNGCNSLKELRIEDGTEILSLGYNSTSYKNPFYDCPLETLYLGRDLSYKTGNNEYFPFYKKSTLK